MTRDYRFGTTVEPHKLKQVFALSGSEWSGSLTPEEFAENELKTLVDYILKGNPGRAFYMESKTGDIHATCIVTQHRALYKEAGPNTIGTVPDASLFGVNNITAIRLSYVFVSKEARGKGLMAQLVPKAIEYTEAEILKKELARSSDKPDSFKLMVMNGDRVDETLVRHYLGKKYVWYLYSAIDLAYTKFGFKSYPIEGYEIDKRIAQGQTYLFVERLLSPNSTGEPGKKLRLLDGSQQNDRDLISLILLGKQLGLLTDMNKNVYHSQLLGDQHSSLSLSNLSSALLASKLGSRPSSAQDVSAVSAVTMKFKNTAFGDSVSEEPQPEAVSTAQNERTQERRKSSILQLGVPKFAILPDLFNLDHKFNWTKAAAEKVGTSQNKRFSSIYGAVLTNELQKKSFYVLWMMIKGSQVTIVAMGEMNVDLFGALTDPRGFTNPVERRRSSSFTGINDMGGFNFQDLDLLVNTAVYVAQQQSINANGSSVLVNINDLPTTIPPPVLHDFFLNYLPRTVLSSKRNTKDEGKEEKEEISASEVITYHASFGTFGVLPMLRKYGSNSGDFYLDWVANSLITWG